MALALLLMVVSLGSPAELTLDDCRASARAQHPRVAAARALQAAAEARTALARAGFLPTLTGDVTWLGADGSGALRAGSTGAASNPGSVANQVFGFADVWGAGLSLRETVWDFGRTSNAYAAAQAVADAAELDSQAALETLDVEAEAAFRTAVSSAELVRAMDEARQRAAAHLEQARARVELGLRPTYDVTRAQVDVANAELGSVAAHNAQAVARAQLGTACGLESLAAGVTLQAPPPRVIERLPELDAALEQAFQRRREVRAAQRRLDAAGEALDAAEASWFPSLGVTGGVSYRGADPASLVPGWNAQVQLSVPVLSGGADVARIHEAEANVAGARAVLAAVRSAVSLEVEAGLLAVKEAVARSEVAGRLRSAATEALSLAEARYATGLADALELGDAQAGLALADAQHVRADLDVAVALARLERLLGREP